MLVLMKLTFEKYKYTLWNNGNFRIINTTYIETVKHNHILVLTLIVFRQWKGVSGLWGVPGSSPATAYVSRGKKTLIVLANTILQTHNGWNIESLDDE